MVGLTQTADKRAGPHRLGHLLEHADLHMVGGRQQPLLESLRTEVLHALVAFGELADAGHHRGVHPLERVGERFGQ